MKTTLALATFLWASISMANITGQWTGWGDWTYQGSGTHCDSMKLNYIETDTKLVRKPGYFDCQVVGLDIAEGEWTKQGNNLMVDGEIVGTITDTTLHLSESYDENVTVVSDIAIEGTHFDYSEIWYDKDGSVIYEITGRLFKKQ